MGAPVGKGARRGVRTMQRIIERGHRVVTQTKLRVFKGITKSALKIVSIFESHTRILRRGKAHKPTEYGHMVKVQEADGGIVTDIAVVTEHDAKLLVPSVEHHKKVFGRVPHVVATDRGFFSLDNVRDVAAMGVRCVAVPKPGYRSPDLARARERSRPFRRARAWRAGGEARIARLKHTFGMHRTRYRGDGGVARIAYWAGIANNLRPSGDTKADKRSAGPATKPADPLQATRLRGAEPASGTTNSAPPCSLELPRHSPDHRGAAGLRTRFLAGARVLAFGQCGGALGRWGFFAHWRAARHPVRPSPATSMAPSATTAEPRAMRARLRVRPAPTWSTPAARRSTPARRAPTRALSSSTLPRCRSRGARRSSPCRSPRTTWYSIRRGACSTPR